MKQKIILRLLSFTLLFGISTNNFAQFQLFESFGVDQADLALHQVVNTSDGGYLLVNSQSCYFPGGVVIEGCLLNIHLIKTDAAGQVLWKSDVPTYHSSFFNIKALQNSDDSYTITLSEPTSFECGEIVIGGFGWEQTTTYQLSSTGEITETIVWQDDCTYMFEDMIFVEDDNKLMVVNNNVEPFEFESGKALKIDKDNQIIAEQSFDDNQFRDAKLLRVQADQIFVFYKEDNINRLSLLNDQGVLQWSETITEDELLYPHDLWQTADGNLMLSFYHVWEPNKTQLIKITTNADVVWEREIADFRATNFLEMEDYLICASTILSEDLDQEIVLVYLDEQGQVFDSQVIANEEWEQPTQIFLTSDNKLGVAGNLKCCEEDNFDPSEVFLAIVADSLITNAKDLSITSYSQLSPNPASTTIRLTLSEHMQHPTFLLFANDGALIWNKNVTDRETEWDISTLTPGIYYYQLIGEKGIETAKLIKH